MSDTILKKRLKNLILEDYKSISSFEKDNKFSQNTVQKLLKDDKPFNPNFKTLVKISKALNVSTDYLLGISDHKDIR